VTEPLGERCVRCRGRVGVARPVGELEDEAGIGPQLREPIAELPEHQQVLAARRGCLGLEGQGQHPGPMGRQEQLDPRCGEGDLEGIGPVGRAGLVGARLGCCRLYGRLRGGLAEGPAALEPEVRGLCRDAQIAAAAPIPRRPVAEQEGAHARQGLLPIQVIGLALHRPAGPGALARVAQPGERPGRRRDPLAREEEGQQQAQAMVLGRFARMIGWHGVSSMGRCGDRQGIDAIGGLHPARCRLDYPRAPKARG
jgi:hypothetical protein